MNPCVPMADARHSIATGSMLDAIISYWVNFAKGLSMNNIYILACAPGGQMRVLFIDRLLDRRSKRTRPAPVAGLSG
jgi:hypothetical protein